MEEVSTAGGGREEKGRGLDGNAKIVPGITNTKEKLCLQQRKGRKRERTDCVMAKKKTGKRMVSARCTAVRTKRRRRTPQSSTSNERAPGGKYVKALRSKTGLKCYTLKGRGNRRKKRQNPLTERSDFIQIPIMAEKK